MEQKIEIKTLSEEVMFKNCLEIKRYALFRGGKEISYVRVKKYGEKDYRIEGVWTDKKERHNGYATTLFQQVKNDYIGKSISLSCFKELVPFYEMLGFKDCTYKNPYNDGKIIVNMEIVLADVLLPKLL